MYEPKIGEKVWCLYQDEDYEITFEATVQNINSEVDERYPYYELVSIGDNEEYSLFSSCIYKAEADLLEYQLDELYVKRNSLNRKIGYLKDQLDEVSRR